MVNRIFKHNKTGEIYELLMIALECTNSRVIEGQSKHVAVYRKLLIHHQEAPMFFTRDLEEFTSKFTEV